MVVGVGFVVGSGDVRAPIAVFVVWIVLLWLWVVVGVGVVDGVVGLVVCL